jgi:hypothetical protein
MSNGHAAAAADLLGDFSNGGDDHKVLLSNGGGGSAAIKGPLDKQIEVKTSDGRRRITPMYIPPAVETNGEWSRHSFSSERQEIPHEKRGMMKVLFCPNFTKKIKFIFCYKVMFWH